MRSKLDNDVILVLMVLLAIVAILTASMGADYAWTWLFCDGSPVYVNWRLGYVCPDALRGL